MTADFALLDRPDILSVMFYPRHEYSAAPQGAADIFVPVADKVTVHCRFYPNVQNWPVVLFFHGNGEVVADYDGIAPVFHHFGLSLMVADYRGYGQSGGRPTFSSMMGDAHKVKAAAFDLLNQMSFTGPRFLMGRSLGALSAVELGAEDPDGFDGLVIESGAAGVRGWSRFATGGDTDAWAKFADAQRARLAAITLPALLIHGAWDELIPLETADEVLEALGSTNKYLEVIPESGHNDLMANGLQQYFMALRGFIDSVTTV